VLTISNYHYIRNDFSAPYPSIFGLSPETFKHQLVKLQELGDFISPKELLEHTDEIIHSNQNYFLVTFDDGLREQFEIAKPILDNLQIEAMYFVNSINFTEKQVSLVHKIHLIRSQVSPEDLMSSFMKSTFKSSFELSDIEKEKAIKHYNFDEVSSAYLKYCLNFKLSAKQLSKVINDLFEIYFDTQKTVDNLYMTEEYLKILADKNQLGSHSHSHLALGLLDAKSIKTELKKTKEYLEKITHTKIEMLSYPYGNKESYAFPVPDIAKNIGYKLGFTMERGSNCGNEDRLLLKRFDCNDLITGKNYKKNL
jgi:peptidoglycan/xylan/chitin deacetylase (PgdA/CDA1 family)